MLRTRWQGRLGTRESSHGLQGSHQRVSYLPSTPTALPFGVDIFFENLGFPSHRIVTCELCVLYVRWRTVHAARV
jgi:hypothetical protein